VWKSACLSGCVRTVTEDTRYTLRAMRRSPGFYTLVIGILALGNAASTSVFSLVDGVLLRPLPYQHPERLVALKAVGTRPPFGANGSVTFSDFEQLQIADCFI
jgi:hypothetical protein